MKQLILITLLTALWAFPQAGAQNKITYVYLDSILQAHPGYTESLIRYDSLKTAFNSDLGQEQEKLNEKNGSFLEKYQLKGGETLEEIGQMMAPADSMVFQMLLDDNTVFQNRRKSYQNILQYVYAKDIEPILLAVQGQIETYAREHKIEVVFIAEQIKGSYIFLDPSGNITQAVIDRLTR